MKPLVDAPAEIPRLTRPGTLDTTTFLVSLVRVGRQSEMRFGSSSHHRAVGVLGLGEVLLGGLGGEVGRG